MGLRRQPLRAVGHLSTPNFWLGILMIFLFSVTLGWLPASGYVRLGEDWRASLATTIMPAFVLGNAHRRRADAPHPQRHAAGDGRRLRPHRARQGPDERRVVLKHALRNAHDAGDHPGRARVRHAAVGRGADRADLHHPGLRQADRRCRVQPRLRRGAGRRAGDGHDLHRAEPAGRRRLHAGQSEAARHDRRHAARPSPSPTPARRTRGRAPGAGSSAARAPWSALVVVVLLRRCSRVLAPLDRALRSHRHELERGAQGAVVGALARHRRGRPRRAVAASSGARAPRSAPALVSVGIALGVGVPLGLLAGYAGGWIDAVHVAHRRRHAGRARS